MPQPTVLEKKLERWLLQRYYDMLKITHPLSNIKITKYPELYNDDYKSDGIIEFDGGEIFVEGRGKGFPNHEGRTTTFFFEGWKTRCLQSGIYLNQSTIERYINKGFVYLVKIRDCKVEFKPRYANITPEKVDELLRQPEQLERSTNSQRDQLVKKIPLSCFIEF